MSFGKMRILVSGILDTSESKALAEVAKGFTDTILITVS